MIPFRAKTITVTRSNEKMTMRMPGIPGTSSGPREKGSSTIRRASPPRINKTAEIAEPVIDPNPPTTMMISKLKVKKR